MRLPLLILAFTQLTLAAAAAPQAETRTLDERFRTYREGSDGSPRWLPVRGNWRVTGGTYEQLSADYDCASMFATYQEGSFRIDAEFEHLDGDPGAGFIFASRERDNTQFAQMVRFDGAATILAGYFQNGEFTGTVSGKTARIGSGSRHTLSLIVDRDSGSFEVLLDGTRAWGRRERLVYAGGYVGLESSAGRVRYHRVRITPMKSRSRSLDWIRQFAVTPSGDFLVPSGRLGSVTLVDRNGTTLRPIGSPADGGGQLRAPTAVSMLHDSLVVVTDSGAGCVHLFSLDGRWKRSSGWKGSGPGQFNAPVAVAASADGRCFVLDRNNARVQVLDDTLGTRGEFGKAELSGPTALAVEAGVVWVVNAGLGRIERYRWDGRKAAWAGSLSYGGGEARGIAVRNGRIYLSLVNEIRAYDSTGALLKTFAGRAIDFIHPQGIVLSPRGVCFADYFGGRLVETTFDLLDPAPAVAADTSGTVVSWSSAETGHGVVTLQETGEEFAGELFGTSHRVRLPAGRRGTSHMLLAPTLRTVPPRARPSRSFPLPPAAAPGQALYARLPMLALIFANVVDSAGTPALPDSELTRITRQLSDAVRFYWMHSRMRLLLDLETLVIHEPHRRAELYGSEWWYPPNDSLIAYYLRVNGKDPGDYSGMLYLTCTQAVDTATRSWALAGKGGAFTNGVGTGKGYGISWWDVTRAHHNAGNNWLMVHEFNHQLDDIFMASGYPEYWFNHISPTIGTAGPFGEHFDANRHILRIVPHDEWYDLAFTRLEQAADADGDGIPDDDPRLPLDEARLGSSPLSHDSDGDGVSDGDELAFSGWITEGWGETSGRPIFPALRSADADGDGIPDGRDPLPCSPLATEAPRGVLTRLGSVDDARASGLLSCRWNADTLEFRIAAKRPLPVKIMIDLEHDGWFSGSGNLLLTAAPGTGGEQKLQVFDGSSPSEWPHMNEDLAKNVSRSVVWEDAGGEHTCRVTLAGLPLTPGSTLGVLVGLLAPFDGGRGDRRYVTFFEPNRFFPLSLTP